MPKREDCSQPDIAADNLYAVLLLRPHTWHYAFFLSASDASSGSFEGTMWTLKQSRTDDHWFFVCSNVPEEFGLPNKAALFMQLGSVADLGNHEEVASAISGALVQTPLPNNTNWTMYNSRTWLMEAIGELEDGGYVSCGNKDSMEKDIKIATQIATKLFRQDGMYAVMDLDSE